MGKKSGSGIRIRDEQLKILQFFDADQGWKKFGSGIWDKQGSATLLCSSIFFGRLGGEKA
jgi:hypothetical protein